MDIKELEDDGLSVVNGRVVKTINEPITIITESGESFTSPYYTEIRLTEEDYAAHIANLKHHCEEEGIPVPLWVSEYVYSPRTQPSMPQ